MMLRTSKTLSHLHKSCQQLVTIQNVPSMQANLLNIQARGLSVGHALWKTAASSTNTTLGSGSGTKQQRTETNSAWEIDIEKLIRTPRIGSSKTGLRNTKQSKHNNPAGGTYAQKPQREKISDKKTPPWLRDMHADLFKCVLFPATIPVSRDKDQEELQALSTSALLSMARSIQSVDRETMKVIVALWRRLNSMTVEEMLTAADIFYLQGVSAPWYTSALISYADEMFESLTFTPHQLTRLTFHISQHGSAPPSLLDAIEGRMSETLPDFDINLIAVLCYLLFVGQNRIRSLTLVDQISKRLLQEVDLVSIAYLPMLMKTFRFSNFIKTSFYKELGDRLLASGSLQRFSKPSQVMHLAFTYAAVRVTHPELFVHILSHCESRPSQYRLKDLAKIIWACGTLVTNEERHMQLIQKILEHLRGDKILKQVQDYPDNMMELLMGLALLKIYPYDLINIVFDAKFVQKLLGLNHEREKFLQMEFLNESLSIECPDYNGHRLLQKDCHVVSQHLKNLSLDVDLKFRKSVMPAVTALEEGLGQGKVQCKFALPHFRTSDILVTFDDKQKCFVDPEPLSVSNSTTRLSDTHLHRVVILLVSLAQTSYDNQPLGMLHCKIRQLTALGYKVIIVDADEALSYTCQSLTSTRNALLAHLSHALDIDITKYIAHSKKS